MKVAIGSQNPVKIEGARSAFTKVWPEQSWEVNGAEVSSGVSSQPMSDAEAIRGAGNRARRARAALDADFGVGIEGGISKVGKHYFTCGWAVVVDRDGNEGIGSSIRMIVPEKMMRLIREGKELGEVCDVIFGGENTKQHQGHFGLMTNNAITRPQAYRDGVISALASFIHPHLRELG